MTTVESPRCFRLDEIRSGFAEACPGARIDDIAPLRVGRASRQWLIRTDEGLLMLKVPVRNQDPEHFRHLVAATRLAAEIDLPVTRYRAFLPASRELGLPVLVQEYVVGDRASDVWESLPPARRQEVAHTLGRWVGTLHTLRGPVFTDALGRRGYSSQAERAARALDSAEPKLSGVDGMAWADVRRRIERRFAAFGAVAPTLCHHDFYLDNVVLRGGRAVRLLDFEHARYSDRFAEFGKIQELLFEWWPETEEPFLAGYAELQTVDEQRIHAHVGLYNVQMCAYFSRYQPDLVPIYTDRIGAWTERDAERG